MPDKIQSVQVLRAIAALLVVLLHVSAFESKAVVGPQLLPLFSTFGASGVDLFFVISGFVMVHTTRYALGSAKTALVFLTKRITRIYPPYWIFSALVFLVYFFFPHLIQRPDAQEIRLLESFLLLPQAQLPLLVVGWTLIHEMYFYCCFAVFLMFPRRTLPVALGFWLAALSGVSVIPALFPGISFGPITTLIAHPLTLEFIFGCFAGLALNADIRAPRLTAATGVIALLLGWSLHYFLTNAAPLAGWTRVLLLGIPYALIVYGFISREIVSPPAYPAVLGRIGDASYSIYLSHFLVVSAFSRTFALATRNTVISPWGVFDNLLFIGVSFSLVLLFGLLSFRYLERPLLALCRRFVVTGA
jgi:exopolysaccharide production protein ExoZ